MSDLCWCGHPQASHVACSLGALVGGVWGCVECSKDFALDPHVFSTPVDSPDRSPVSVVKRLRATIKRRIAKSRACGCEPTTVSVSLADLESALAEVSSLSSALREARATLKDIRDDYDHEEQTRDHRPDYGAFCRVCQADKALRAMDAPASPVSTTRAEDETR